MMHPTVTRAGGLRETSSVRHLCCLPPPPLSAVLCSDSFSQRFVITTDRATRPSKQGNK
ncbi:uncharacterized protein LY79DRAFT_86629 [Colletotrichum navitas]|uniref:Uncharacterized protein n=1 Tax=Colletotrichum navitas TaxID=681940 RepID=A0AAD8PLN9_9PEZI|nr:uncharacterized protein LY79DRAFT_86629 [Colletotrichum navitas]KAK1569438.1 hypothetical protein LY79DRAFT_86629 [Colletotrichum navitas]